MGEERQSGSGIGEAVGRRLFVGNFEFEHRLADPRRSQWPESVQRINAEMAVAWIAMAAEGDFLWLPAEIEEGFFEGLAAQGFPRVVPVREEAAVPGDVELVPWGWTDAVREWGLRWGWRVDAPEQSVVRALNSRRCSAGWEREWGVAPAGVAEVRSLEELESALAHLPEGDERWVLKAEFGMSARERMLGQGRRAEEPVVNWVRKRLRGGGVLFFEPWLRRVAEAGLQYTIPKSGEPVFEGIAELLSDASGGYRGSRFSADADSVEEWQPAVETGFRVARRAQQRGYFGPLGIDSMTYRDAAGVIRLRPLQEINARFTMGRLSLGLRRLLRENEVGSWVHFRWPSGRVVEARSWFTQVCESLPAEVRVIRTALFEAGGRSARSSRSGRSDFERVARCEKNSQGAKNASLSVAGHGSAVVIARRVEQLEAVEQRLWEAAETGGVGAA